MAPILLEPLASQNVFLKYGVTPIPGSRFNIKAGKWVIIAKGSRKHAREALAQLALRECCIRRFRAAASLKRGGKQYELVPDTAYPPLSSGGLIEA